jgi:Holliday junction resolvase
VPKLNARAKGQRGEREACKLMEKHGFSASRNWQAAGAKERPDLHTNFPDHHVEVKWVEKLNIWAAMEQAMRDAKPGHEPVVLHKRNNSKWLITLDAESYICLVKELNVKIN